MIISNILDDYFLPIKVFNRCHKLKKFDDFSRIKVLIMLYSALLYLTSIKEEKALITACRIAD